MGRSHGASCLPSATFLLLPCRRSRAGHGQKYKLRDVRKRSRGVVRDSWARGRPLGVRMGLRAGWVARGPGGAAVSAASRPPGPGEPFPGQVGVLHSCTFGGCRCLFPSGPPNCFCCRCEEGFLPPPPFFFFLPFFPPLSFLPPRLLCGGGGSS